VNVTKDLLEAAAGGRHQEVVAALAQLPDRAKGLSTAAVAAGSAGQWGLSVSLLQDLVMMDEAAGRAAVRAVFVAVSKTATPVAGGEDCDAPLLPLPAVPDLSEDSDGQDIEKVEAEMLKCHRQLLAAIQVCDALYTDWLALRQQQVRERREAVVAAVTAAAAAAAAAAAGTAGAACV
jgi:hypothetical protein